MTLFVFIVIAIALAVAYFYLRNQGLSIPEPSEKRKDLLFGYYGVLDNQVEETKDHVNLLWSLQFEGTDELVKNIRAAQAPTIIDLSNQLMQKDMATGKLFHRAVDSRERLVDLFMRLEREGVLYRLHGVTIADEPNSSSSLEEWNAAAAVVREVAQHFQQIAGLKVLLLLNGADVKSMEPWVRGATADWVGFDWYEKREKIFQRKTWWGRKDGLYIEMQRWLKPGQRTFLVPGGCYGQDPKPFINFAHANPEVAAIIVFLWFDTQDPSVTAPSIRSSPMKEVYVAAGLELAKLRA